MTTGVTPSLVWAMMPMFAQLEAHLAILVFAVGIAVAAFRPAGYGLDNGSLM
ncbi:MAG: hypothetical protein ACLVKA_04020 [Collinsella aerofaciens]